MCVEFPGLFKSQICLGGVFFIFLIQLFGTVMLCDEHDEHDLKSNTHRHMSGMATLIKKKKKTKTTGAFSV